MIKKIVLERFKKFKESEIFFEPFTVLMGENSSGKTTVLQALNLALINLSQYNFVTIEDNNQVRIRGRGVGLSSIVGVNLSDFRELYYAKTSRSGAAKGTTGTAISLVDDKNNEYKLQITSLFGTFNIKCVSSKDNLANNPTLQNKSPLFISGFVGLTAAEERVFPVAIEDRLKTGQVSTIIRNLILETKLHSPENFNKLKARLDSDFNFHLHAVEFDGDKDLHVNAKYSDECENKNLTLDFNASGSGFMQVLQILTPIYRFCPEKSEIVLLDEPDAHLHPNLQSSLAKSLRDIQKELGIQIIISTHSTNIIRAAQPNEVVPISSKQSVCKPLSKREDVEDSIQSALDSYTLAKSIISGKLAFFEDGNISLWEEIDKVSKSMVFYGPSTIPIVKGRGKNDKVPFQMNDILKELLEEDVEILFVRDGDGISEKWREELVKYGKTKKVNIQILDRFEIENYLIEPLVIRNTLAIKHPGKELPTIDEISGKVLDSLKKTISLSKYCYDDSLREEIYQTAQVLGKSEYRDLSKCQSEAREIREKYEEYGDIDNLIKVGMGKEALKVVLSWLNDEKQLNISKIELVKSITPENINSDLKKILSVMKSNERTKVPTQLDIFEEEVVDDDDDSEI